MFNFLILIFLLFHNNRIIISRKLKKFCKCEKMNIVLINEKLSRSFSRKSDQLYDKRLFYYVLKQRIAFCRKELLVAAAVACNEQRQSIGRIRLTRWIRRTVECWRLPLNHRRRVLEHQLSPRVRRTPICRCPLASSSPICAPLSLCLRFLNLSS